MNQAQAECLPFVVDTDVPVEVEKAAAIEAQWPKLHRCRDAGNEVVRLSREDWAGLKFYTTTVDAYASYEWRHCHCMSTLVVVTEIHSMDEE